MLTYRETAERPGSSGRNRDLVLAARQAGPRARRNRMGGVFTALSGAMNPLYIDMRAEDNALCHERLQRFSPTGPFRHPAVERAMQVRYVRAAG